MVQLYFALRLICLAAAALSGVGRPLKLSRWPRLALLAIGLALLGLGGAGPRTAEGKLRRTTEVRKNILLSNLMLYQG